MAGQNASQNQMAACGDVRTQQWRQELERGGEDIGQHHRIFTLRRIGQGRIQFDLIGACIGLA